MAASPLSRAGCPTVRDANGLSSIVEQARARLKGLNAVCAAGPKTSAYSQFTMQRAASSRPGSSLCRVSHLLSYILISHSVGCLLAAGCTIL